MKKTRGAKYPANFHAINCISSCTFLELKHGQILNAFLTTFWALVSLYNLIHPWKHIVFIEHNKTINLVYNYPPWTVMNFLQEQLNKTWMTTFGLYSDRSTNQHTKSKTCPGSKNKTHGPSIVINGQLNSEKLWFISMKLYRRHKKQI